MDSKQSTEKRFALLIDADNVSAKYIKPILDELSKYGTVTYKRIYGDWTLTLHAKWKDALLENSITPIQQFGYTQGKNATDSAMIIDAMDILYTRSVDGFCIVSSDSDFTRLAARIRESGLTVIGMGEKKTPTPFRKACDIFTTLELLVGEHGGKNKAKGAPGSAGVGAGAQAIGKEEIEQAVVDIITDNQNNGKATGLGEVGSRLLKRYPDFDVRSYGTNLLSKLLDEFSRVKITKDGSSVAVELIDDKGHEQERTQASAPAPVPAEEQAHPQAQAAAPADAPKELAEAPKERKGAKGKPDANDSKKQKRTKSEKSVAEHEASASATAAEGSPSASALPLDLVSPSDSSDTEGKGQVSKQKKRTLRRPRHVLGVRGDDEAPADVASEAPDVPESQGGRKPRRKQGDSKGRKSTETAEAVASVGAVEAVKVAEAVEVDDSSQVRQSPTAQNARKASRASKTSKNAKARKTSEPAKPKKQAKASRKPASQETPEALIRRVLAEAGREGVALSELSKRVRAKFHDFKVRDLGFTQFKGYVAHLGDVEFEKAGKETIARLGE